MAELWNFWLWLYREILKGLIKCWSRLLKTWRSLYTHLPHSLPDAAAFSLTSTKNPLIPSSCTELSFQNINIKTELLAHQFFFYRFVIDISRLFSLTIYLQCSSWPAFLIFLTFLVLSYWPISRLWSTATVTLLYF